MTHHVVSTHALFRWLERAHGIDVDGVREEVETEVRDLVASGASGGWVKGLWCVVKNGSVVTFLPKKPPPEIRVRHGNLMDTGARR